MAISVSCSAEQASLIRMRRWIILGLIAVVGIFAVRHLSNAPLNARSDQAVTVDIPGGLGARAIAKRLREAGVLRSPFGFTVAVVLRGVREELKAGTYLFRPRESGRVILDRLVRGDVEAPDLSITFPEGFTLAQIAERLAARGFVESAVTFQGAAKADRFRRDFPFLESVPTDATLEGYLFPDTYRFQRGATADEIIRRMLRRFGEQWGTARAETCPIPSPGGPAAPSAQCALVAVRSVHELVTMASITEREVRSREDRRLVSGILWRRFTQGVGLEADATVRYVLGNWERPLTAEDLRIDSPYNTRRYRGLPPGPIGNAGLDGLTAILSPLNSEYFFYLSARDGRTIFSRTLEEHNRAKVQYLR